MADWVEQYTASLDVRDQREWAHRSYIDAYTRLADRTASLENAAVNPQFTSSTTDLPPTAQGRSATPTKPADQQAPSELLARLRTDLASTQRSRSDLQSQISRLTAVLATLTTQSSSSTQRITTLEREKRDLERRLRDRDEELKGKSKLVENVQDEMVGLNLQLNMAEQRADKLKGENEELVKRWMERMGEEAERMNVESKWA